MGKAKTRVALPRISLHLLFLLGAAFAFLLVGAAVAGAQEIPLETEGPELSAPSASGPTETVTRTLTGSTGTASDGTDQGTRTTSGSGGSGGEVTETVEGAAATPVRTSGPVRSSAGSTVDTVGRAASSTVDAVGRAAGSTVNAVGRAAGSTVDTVGRAAGSAVDTVRRTAGSTTEALARTAPDPVDQVTHRATALLGEGGAPGAVQETTRDLLGTVDARGPLGAVAQAQPLQVAAPARAGLKSDGWAGSVDKGPSFPLETKTGWVVESRRQAAARDSVGPQSLSPVRDTSGTAWTRAPAAGLGSEARIPLVPAPFGPEAIPIPGSLLPGGGGGVSILLVAAFIALFGLAASGLSRWLRLDPALGGPQAILSLATPPG